MRFVELYDSNGGSSEKEHLPIVTAIPMTFTVTAAVIAVKQPRLPAPLPCTYQDFIYCV